MAIPENFSLRRLALQAFITEGGREGEREGGKEGGRERVREEVRE